MADGTAPDLLREFCAENLTHLEAALAAGARRVELCDNLAQGGTTPSAGVIAQAVRIVRTHPGATVRVIIRPRGGDFVYDDAELAAMDGDAREAVRLGADGIVTGCILSVGRILGESAALLFTACFAHGLFGFFEGLTKSGATLTVALYFYAKEQGKFEVAFAIAAILMFLTLLINFAADLVSAYFRRKKAM